ncbi:CGNR zinc finger domain-containing protein [Pseudomonas sp. NPDC088368]|uniref:CGNR zinc finger domain-containing protein n=1 Tax=Pseudomonas sp. NPDC088368 TaxID=3364453 RepID=UPI003828A848
MPTQQQASAVDRLLALLNSGGVGFEQGIDQMENAERFDAFRLPLIMATAEKVGEDSLPLARQLRDCLLTMVYHGGDDPDALAKLNQLSTQRSFHYFFAEASGACLEEQGGETLVGLALRDVAQLRREGKWNRFKICANPDCKAAYFDTTRARTQRWHSYALCGNKANVAAFRSRTV